VSPLLLLQLLKVKIFHVVYVHFRTTIAKDSFTGTWLCLSSTHGKQLCSLLDNHILKLFYRKVKAIAKMVHEPNYKILEFMTQDANHNDIISVYRPWKLLKEVDVLYVVDRLT
jgi:hypothetical protein